MGRRRIDPEIRALREIQTVLDPLDEDARRRVLEYTAAAELGLPWCRLPGRAGLGGRELVAAAIGVLKDAGAPLHYREILRRLTAAGTEIGGDDPAATLLANMGRHPQVERVGEQRSGVYALKSESDSP